MSEWNYRELNRELLDFIDRSPNAFFAVRNLAEMLEEEGFRRLSERERFEIALGGKYYVTRNDSALIALQIPKEEPEGFRIGASHGDSPVFKLKPEPEMTAEGHYLKLNVEKYGGMILSTWLDRPLSVAGRLLYRAPEGVQSVLVNLDRDLLIIPNLAIHMDRKINEGYAYHPQGDLMPLFAEGVEKGRLRSLLADEAGIGEFEILDMDLFLYNRQKGTLLGPEEEFIASGRLDDLASAYAMTRGFLAAEPERFIAVNVVFDNEEVGSRTRQGAGSSFLSDILRRVAGALGLDEEDYLRLLAGSYGVSADNAHAAHPNRPEKADPVNRPFLNGGLVLKYNADQKYTTDAVSGAEFRLLCERAKVPVQTYVNHSDIPGGSTLGNILSSTVPIPMADVGLPQLSMHSAYETAGARDTVYMVRMAEELFRQ